MQKQIQYIWLDLDIQDHEADFGSEPLNLSFRPGPRLVRQLWGPGDRRNRTATWSARNAIVDEEGGGECGSDIGGQLGRWSIRIYSTSGRGPGRVALRDSVLRNEDCVADGELRCFTKRERLG